MLDNFKSNKEEIVEAYNKLLEKYKEGVFGGQKDFEEKGTPTKENRKEDGEERRKED